MNLKDSYHGWLIELIPEPKGYSFQCWIPKAKMAVSDRQTYPSLDLALVAAKKRADLESVSLALIAFLNEVYKQYSLSPEEHVALLNSVVTFVNITSKQQRLLAMTEVSIPLGLQNSQSILCHYKNTTNQIQVARISNIENWYFERVMFPSERIVFETLPEAELEIHMMDETVNSMIMDKIPCSRLQMYD